jgi:hypothetical protein
VPYPFLSDEWVAEMRKIRADYEGQGPDVPISIRMNQIITDVPFGEGNIHAYVDTSAGLVDIEMGHLANPDLTITLEYPTAKAILIDGDPQAAMAAFLGGRIKVDGDITKLLALQSPGVVGGLGPGAGDAYARIRAMTE